MKALFDLRSLSRSRSMMSLQILSVIGLSLVICLSGALSNAQTIPPSEQSRSRVETKSSPKTLDQIVSQFKIGDLSSLEVNEQTCVLITQEVNHIYVHGGHLLLTYDRGKTWYNRGELSGVPYEFLILPPDTFFILWHWLIEGAYPSIKWTKDRGQTWSEIGLQEVASDRDECCFAMARDLRVQDSDVLSIELEGMGRIQTRNQGKTWRAESKAIKSVAHPPRQTWCRTRIQGESIKFEIKGAQGWREVLSLKRLE